MRFEIESDRYSQTPCKGRVNTPSDECGVRKPVRRITRARRPPARGSNGAVLLTSEIALFASEIEAVSGKFAEGPNFNVLPLMLVAPV